MAKKLKIHSKDDIVHSVIKKFDERSAVGFDKYGTTLAADSDSLYRWVNDVQEELMDAILYMQKVKVTLQEVMEESYIQDLKREFENDLNSKSTKSTTMYPGDINVTYDYLG